MYLRISLQMHDLYQKTLSKKISFEGIGLHSGKSSKITIFPSDVNKGIFFKRVDIEENNLIKASFKNVPSAKLCTTLQNENGVKVSTVEHLLAALYIYGVDNALIEIDNEEVPIMDGSAKEFINSLKSIKLVNQSQKRKYIKILKKEELIDGSRKIFIEPKDTFEVDFKLNYENRIIGQQRNLVNFQKDALKEITESRTFCLLEDVEKIKKFGLAKGGSLDNAVVVDENKVLNETGLRNQKEFVNHKILDLAGDFLLSGFRVMGKVTCYHGGHELTNMFLRKLIEKKTSYKIIELEEDLAISQTKAFLPIKEAVNA